MHERIIFDFIAGIKRQGDGLRRGKVGIDQVCYGFCMAKSMMNTGRLVCRTVHWAAVQKAVLRTAAVKLKVSFSHFAQARDRYLPYQEKPFGSHRRYGIPNKSILYCVCRSCYPIRRRAGRSQDVFPILCLKFAAFFGHYILLHIKSAKEVIPQRYSRYLPEDSLWQKPVLFALLRRIKDRFDPGRDT